MDAISLRARALLGTLLVFLLVFMPYSTFVLQVIRHLFELANHPLPSIIAKLMIGWKEALLVLAVAIVAGIAIREKALPFRLTVFDRFLLAFMGVGTVVGYALSGHLSWAVFGFRYDFSPFVFYAVARTVLVSRDQLLLLMRRLVLCSVPVLSFGLAQTVALPFDFMEHFGYHYGGTGITGNPLPPYHFASASLQVVRAMSTFPGPNSLAMYAVLIILVLWFLGREWFSKPVRLGIIALGLVTLIATFSRGHLISLVAAAGIVALFGWLGRRPGTLAFRSGWVGGAVIAVLVLTFAATLYAGTFKGAQNGLTRLVLHDESSEIHRDVRLQAWDSIKTHPLGMGLGTSGLATTNTGGTVFNPESWFIQVTQELGWLGLIATGALIVLLYRLLAVMEGDLAERTDRRLLVLFVAGFASVIVSANFLPSWFEVGSLSWWILFGFFVSDYLGSFPRSQALPR